MRGVIRAGAYAPRHVKLVRPFIGMGRRTQFAGKARKKRLTSWRAEIQCHLGDTNAALDMLRKSYAIRSRAQGYYAGPLDNLLFVAVWEPLYDDPRFKDILDKIGYTKVMPPRR